MLKGSLMRSAPNLIGLRTLYLKEVWRFLKVYNQTLFAPAVTALLFLAVFNLAVGRHVERIGETPFAAFMVSGLIAMSAMQNAFANSSSSLTMGKVLGTVIDYLMPPLSPGEIVLGMAGAAVTRGLAVAALTGLFVYPFAPFEIAHPGAALFYAALASLAMGLIGLMAGIFAESFDQMAAVTAYVVTPLAFLSGTFYPIDRLPPLWRAVSAYNPFFYMIDGFRYGMTGHAEGSLAVGAAALVLLSAALWAAVYAMIRTGYRLKG
jgi:ABC-2 type transport system permease protein